MPAGPDDLIYSAEVEDHTGEFFDRFDNRVSDMEGRMDGAFSGLEQGGSKAAVIMGLVGGAVAGVTAKLVDLAFTGAQAFLNYSKDAALFAARVDTLGVALEVAGAHAGYSKEEIQQFEDEVKGMGITTSKARIALQQMAQANLDLSKAADLARASQDAAVVAGVDSSEAFNRILYAITSLQPEILRTLNLTVNMEAEMERYAKSVNKTASELSASDRQQALLNGTMRAAAEIAGTYEAAMGTVGKKLTSLPRYFEEIQLAIGQAFQPALSVGVDYLTEKLKNLLQWLKDNEEQIAMLGDDLADFVNWLTVTGDSIGGFASQVLGWLKELDQAVAAWTYGTEDQAEILRRQKKDLEEWRQLLIDVASWVARAAAHVVEFIRLAVDGLKPLWLLLNANLDAWNEFDRVLAQHIVNMNEIQNQYERNRESLDKWLSTTEDAADATEDLGIEFDKAASDAMKLEEALDLANDRLEDFARKMEDQAADLAIKASRAATEAALRESWAREDLERKHQSRLRSIIEQASSSRQDAIKKYAQQRIDIERDYQRRIRDIQRDFEFQAGELARSRDAVGLLRLMRSHDKALKDAEIARKDRLTDAKRAFSEEMKLMNERIQEQLRRAEEAHRLELEDYERMKARERQIQALQDKWAEEDRQAAYAKQLAELIIQMGNIEGITHEGLMDLIAQWRMYFGDLTDAATRYMEKLNRVIKPGGKYAPPVPGGYNPTVPTPHGGYGYGQGGRVSQMMLEQSLADRLFSSVAPPPIPKVQMSGTNIEKKVLEVKVSGDALTPQIQRQIANALLEIERNASGG